MLYRQVRGELEVLLAHPGGPFFTRKDLGYWGLPKGLIEPGEVLLEAAIREFCEETSLPRPDGPFLELGEVRQKSGKRVHGWACAGDCDPTHIVSNEFEMEWPRGSGRQQSFPEIDRADWFDVEAARRHINAAQASFLDRLAEQIESAG